MLCDGEICQRSRRAGILKAKSVNAQLDYPLRFVNGGVVSIIRVHALKFIDRQANLINGSGIARGLVFSIPCVWPLNFFWLEKIRHGFHFGAREWTPDQCS